MDISRKDMEKQFALRANVFDLSANWITDRKLISAHFELAGVDNGRLLELCCGTGQIGRAFKEKGWNVVGIDVSKDMLKISSRYFPVYRAKAEHLPFRENSFDLVVCRQSFQFLDVRYVLDEAKRVLCPKGRFIVSLTIPFGDMDKEWLKNIHITKQKLLKNFLTREDLIYYLESSGLKVRASKELVIRESINRWMGCAPELDFSIKEQVKNLIVSAPEAYKKIHKVEIRNGELLEDWNWIIIVAENIK